MVRYMNQAAPAEDTPCSVGTEWGEMIIMTISNTLPSIFDYESE